MAHALRAALAAKGHTVSNSESLELIAKALGVTDWNTLSAAIRQAAEDVPPDPERPAEPRSAPGSTTFGADLTASLHRTVRLANQRRHQYATLEHLLLALLDDPDAAAVITACRADLATLGASLLGYVDTELGILVTDQDEDAGPTQGFQRVMQRALIHQQSVGGGVITGANVLVAIFSEPESHAAYFLQEQGVTRTDAVNVITGGAVDRGGEAAA
jgi:hypothetical protein